MTSFKLPHKLLAEMLAKGVFATTKSDRSIDKAVNLTKLVRLSVGEGWVEVASVAPDVASSVREVLPPECIQGTGDVCVSAADIVKDIDTLQKPHTVTVEWEGHGVRQNPAGKVTVTAVTEKGRKTLTWAYDAYDPDNVPCSISDFLQQEPSVTFHLGELKQCINSIAWAVKICTENVFDNIMLRVTETTAQLVATDAERLGAVTANDGAHKIGKHKADFILLNANLLKKALPLWGDGEGEVAVIEDDGHVGLVSNGFAVRFPVPANEILSKYPSTLAERLLATEVGVSAVLDRIEFIQAAKASIAKGSNYCSWTVADGATEVSADYRNAAKPALVGCQQATGTLRAPICLSSWGLLNAAQAMQGDVSMAFNPKESRVIVRDTTNPRLFYAFQRGKEM